MRCPHCKSDFLTMFRTPEECPKCGSNLRDDDGTTLREIDHDFDGLRLRLDQQTFRRIKKGTLVCVGLALISLVPFPPLNWAVSIAIMVQTWIWARPLVSSPYARYFSPSRRMVTRWLSRFVVLTLVGLHGQSSLPLLHFFAFATSPLIFVVTCGTVWAYHRFHLDRERQRMPVTLLEKVLLVVAAILAIAAVVGLVILALLVGGLVKGLTGQ